jgi:hypothetical protein
MILDDISNMPGNTDSTVTHTPEMGGEISVLSLNWAHPGIFRCHGWKILH